MKRENEGIIQSKMAACSTRGLVVEVRGIVRYVAENEKHQGI